MRNCISKLGTTFMMALVAPGCLAADVVLSTLADQSATSYPTDVRGAGPGVAYASSFYTGEGRHKLNTVVIEQAAPFDDGSMLEVKLLSVTFGDLGAQLTPITDLVYAGELDVLTQYPQFTKYVAYTPATEVLLQPESSYVVSVGLAANNPLASSALVFSESPDYVAEPGWQLGPDLISMVFDGEQFWFNPFNPGHLKFALEATLSDSSPIPPPNSPPDVSKAVASLTMLWPPNGALVPVSITGVTDPDGDQVTIVVTSVWQDEPLSMIGKRVLPDAIMNGTDVVQLRAVRLGVGDGRVYHVSFTASDGKPNGTSEGEIVVGVPHDMGVKPIDSGLANAYFNSLGR